MRHATAERLLVQLSPKTQSFTRSVQGQRTLTTPADIAASLSFAHLPDIAVAITRVAYLDDRTARGEVSNWMRDTIDHVAVEQGWRRVKARHRDTLAEIVVDAVLPRRCPACKGRRKVPDGSGKPVSCPPCGAAGSITRSTRDKADSMGVCVATWRRVWRPREAELKRAYTDIESRVILAVKRVLG